MQQSADSDPADDNRQQLSPSSPTKSLKSSVAATESRDIVVTVKSIMSDSTNLTINLSTNSTVGELKSRCCLANYRFARQIFVFNGRELINDNSPISEYGMTSDCEVYVVARMETGRQSSLSPSSTNLASIMFITPLILPDTSKSMTNLRRTIRTLNNHKSSSKTVVNVDQTTISPQKNAEHLLMRKRLKEVYQKRRQLRGKTTSIDESKKLLSSSQPGKNKTRIISKENASPKRVDKRSANVSTSKCKLNSSQNSKDISFSSLVTRPATGPIQETSAISNRVLTDCRSSTISATPLSTDSQSSMTSSCDPASSRWSKATAKRRRRRGSSDFSSSLSSLSSISLSNRHSAKSSASITSSSSSSSGSVMVDDDTGSVCGSFSQSPASTETNISPPGLINPNEVISAGIGGGSTGTGGGARTSARSSVGVSSNNSIGTDKRPMTKKELLSYFDVPETREELQRIRRVFYDPPQNVEELKKVKQDMSALCGVCRRRLPVAIRSIVCACNLSFCSRHRDTHNCTVDYKYTERDQLARLNPKIGDGGVRKGKSSEEDEKSPTPTTAKFKDSK